MNEMGMEVNWQSLRFGVEIEFVNGAPEQVELLPGWVMSLDEKQIDDSGAESGSELKPPPIRWADREQIREMLDRLHAVGAAANWNCGLHVHVGLEPWGAEILPRFVDAALRSQEALRRLLNTGEDRLIFCPPLTPEMRDRFLAHPEEASLRHTGRPQSHRCGINLAAWYDIGTVEIRYSNGSLDYLEVLRTVELCLRFVAAVGAGRLLPGEPQALAAALGVPAAGYPPALAAPRWYRERMWMEQALLPLLDPLVQRLVPGGELHHVLPHPEGLLVAIEGGGERLTRHLVQWPVAGWERVRQMD